MQQAIEESLQVEIVLSLYRRMVEMREFELKVQELYRATELPGFVHLYVGEEAVAAGVCAHLERRDFVFSTHRGHGHALAKGVPARDVMSELYGKATGSSGGRGGSMHLYAPEYGFMGTNGIVGSGIPLAAGAALGAQLRKSEQVSVAFFGDGTSNSGSFHEGLNFAAAWNLPVVYVCENNLYATEMAFHRATKSTEIAERAAAYRMPGVAVDGNDVLAVYDATAQAIQRARSGDGPTLIECKTYRFLGHHEGDPGTDYRTKDEVESWKRRCPIKLLRETALAKKIASVEVLDEIDRETAQLIDDCVEFARKSPLPEPSTVLNHLFD